jgi:hypothetical protein
MQSKFKFEFGLSPSLRLEPELKLKLGLLYSVQIRSVEFLDDLDDLFFEILVGLVDIVDMR